MSTAYENSNKSVLFETLMHALWDLEAAIAYSIWEDFCHLIHSRERFVPSGSALNKNVYALSDFLSREASIEK